MVSPDSDGEDSEESTDFRKLDGVLILLAWGGLVVSLHTSVLPRVIEVVVIGSALAYVFVFALMLFFHSASLIEYGLGKN